MLGIDLPVCVVTASLYRRQLVITTNEVLGTSSML